MIIWVFIGTLSIGSKTIDVAPNMEFAFADKAICEYAIAESKGLRCIPLKMVGIPRAQ